MLGPGDERDVLEPVAAVVHRRRTLVELAFKVEGLLVEAGQKQPELFLEQLAVLFRIE